MLKKIHVAVLFAVTSLGSQAAGLAEVTERALSRNPEVRSRLHDYLSSGYDQQAARGGLRPRVDVEAYYGYERRDTPLVDYGNFDHPGASIQLRQLLFDGFATTSEIRRLGHTKATRYYELLSGTDDIAVEAARAYLDVQRYRQLSGLAQDNWAVHRELYDQIDERTRAGVGRRVDLEQAAGRLALAQSNWLTETSNLHDVSARFERVVGESPPALADVPDINRHLPAEREVLPIALRDNPQFLAAVSNLRAARAQTDVRRAANMPNLEFRASYGAERNRQGVNGPYSDAVAQLVMNYNLYRGGSDDARIRASQEQYYAAVELRDRACRDIRQNTVIAWNDSRRLRDQLQFLEQHALSTEKARDAYRQQFDIGQRTLLDLLDTENELFEARRAVVRARYDLRIAEFRVLGQTHRLLTALELAPTTSDGPPQEDDKVQADDNLARCNTEMPALTALDTRAAMAARTTSSNAQLALAPAAAQPVAPPPAPVPQAAPVDPLDKDITAQVQAWAAAWSARDLDTYLGFYSDAFKPATLPDRDNWRALRARRLAKSSIDVKVENVRVQRTGPDSATATFLQHYRSPDLSDDVTKTLHFRREGNRWKIEREVAPPAGTN